MEIFFDDIAAISTPIGEGGIGIVRISGKNALEIASKISDIPEKIKNSKSHRIHYGHVLDNDNQFIDEVLFLIMKAPKTFTMENVVEINCHGGLRVVQKVLEQAIKNGARLAEPGEFTKRAFLNGRIDLMQAEGIIDIINAKTDKSLSVAMSNLSGKTSSRINKIKSKIIDLLANIELSIDFIEQDVEIISKADIEKMLNDIKGDVIRLVATYKRGTILREGAKIAIIGAPNVGKSSLLNALLDKDKAIVTDIPGTTRDIIEDVININGILVKLIDTAGIRDTDDHVEKIGVKKTVESIENADLLLLVLDLSKELSDEEKDLLEKYKDKNKIIVLNKVDLEQKLSEETLMKCVAAPLVKISAKLEEGIQELNSEVINLLVGEQLTVDGDGMLTRERHKQALENSLDKIEDIFHIIYEQGLEFELLAFDLRYILDELGAITGEVTPEDVLDNIFSNFCIGK